MILIADSGSTKTDWSLIDASGIPQRLPQTAGINPYQQQPREIIETLKAHLPTDSPKLVKQVYFYGTGCALPKQQQLVKEALTEVFTHAKVVVEHDLLGAVRSMCGHQPGIACILGTGANACSYDGQQITSPPRSLGYILGDEGSGAYFGKQLVIDFLQEAMPVDLRVDFFEQYALDRSSVLEHVYQKPYPNRYLASFAPFMKAHLTNPYIKQLLTRGFSDFLEKYVLTLPDFSPGQALYFTGSVAWHFDEALRQTASRKQLYIANIIKNPMEGLIAYHLADKLNC